MDRSASGGRRGPLLALFFVSGATSLVWQTVWGRHLHLVFGTSTFAIATVLTAFMAGLAVGGEVMARRIQRITRPLAWYGALEAAIGAYALLFPSLVRAVEPAYLGFWRAFEPHPVVFGAWQLVLVGALLVVPTAAMGATLPLLARVAAREAGEEGDAVAVLYAVNTAGAVAGTALCGFVLLPWLGLWATTTATASANLLLGVGALTLERRASAWTAVEPSAAGAAPFPLLLTAGLAGFASLLYEVAFFRVLGLTLGASAYAFTVMLLAFLIGIALGGRLGGPLADRLLATRGVNGVLAALVGVELAVGVSAWLVMYAFQELPWWYVLGFDLFGGERSAFALWATSCALCVLILLLPTVCMGAAFPLAVRAAVRRPGEVGAAVGRVYAANTAGGVPGAALAGFLLLPTLEVRGTIAAGMAINALAALAAAWGIGPALRRRVLGGWTAVVVGTSLAWVALPPPWDPLWMTSGMYKHVSELKDRSYDALRKYASTGFDLLYYREGLSSVVTVAQSRSSSNRWLANNGKVDASTSFDMPTQMLVGLLPMQFVERPADVVVIGLASGITAGASTLAEGIERVEVVELEPAIVEAARLFDAWNHEVLLDPRVRLVLNDGRNHMLLQPPGRYDVVVSEPPNPWLTGVSNLFTAEYFAMGRTRVKAGGVWSQWVQLYGMDDRDLRSIIGTFCSVWPHVLVYMAARNADMVLLGSDAPLIPSQTALARLLDQPAVARQLAVEDLDDPAAIWSLLLMDRDAALRFVDGEGLNTDDNMRVEYSAPLHLHVNTQSTNIPLLRQHAWTPWPAIGPDGDLLARIARRHKDLSQVDRAVEAMIRAALHAPPGGQVERDRLDEAWAWFEDNGADGLRPSQRDAVMTEVLRQDFEAEVTRVRDAVAAEAVP